MKVTSLIIIISSLSSFYCNAESAPNKDNRVVHLNNNEEEEAYTLYPDLNEERPDRRHLQDKSMATASSSYYPTLSPTFESMSMQAAARNAEDQHDAVILNVNPPKKKAAPKRKNAPKSSKTKSRKRSRRCRRRRRRSRRSSKSSKSCKSSKSSSSSRSGRGIEPPADASIRRSPDRDTYEYDSEDGSI